MKIEARTKRYGWPAESLAIAASLALLRGPAHGLPIQGVVAHSGIGTVAPPAPAGCLAVSSGAGLQKILDSAPDGSAFCLEPGTYQGPLSIRRGLTLWGRGRPRFGRRVRARPVEVAADHVQLLGFMVLGSGVRFDRNDAAIHVRGSLVLVEGLRIEGALFGLTAEQSSDVTLRHNEIIGDAQKLLGLRGDAIRVWETRNARVEQNVVSHGRDILVWYSPDIRVAGNIVRDSRYGTHFMYSQCAVVEGNTYTGNVVSIFLMYSQGVTVSHNWLLASTRSDGMGLGIKDSSGLAVRDNLILSNNTGLYVDASPPGEEDSNRVEGNLFGLNGTAVVFHASESHTRFTRNTFRDNRQLAAVEGDGDEISVEWRGNYFDDCRGYDVNGDGVGDLPYELRSLADQLTGSYPSLAFFQGTPALGLLDTLSQVVPLLEPKLILRDPVPRMSPAPFPEENHAD